MLNVVEIETRVFGCLSDLMWRTLVFVNDDDSTGFQLVTSYSKAFRKRKCMMTDR